MTTAVAVVVGETASSSSSSSSLSSSFSFMFVTLYYILHIQVLQQQGVVYVMGCEIALVIGLASHYLDSRSVVSSNLLSSSFLHGPTIATFYLLYSATFEYNRAVYDLKLSQ